MKAKIILGILVVVLIAVATWAYTRDSQVALPAPAPEVGTKTEVAELPQEQGDQACRDEYEKARWSAKLLLFAKGATYGNFTFKETDDSDPCYLTHHFTGTATISGVYGLDADGTLFFVINPEHQNILPRGQTGWWTSPGLAQLFSQPPVKGQEQIGGNATIVVSNPVLTEAFEEDGITLNSFTIVEVHSNKPAE